MCAFEATRQPENPDLAKMLAHHGFDRDTLPALLLLPLAHVAWADGTMAPEEAERILELGAESGLLTPAARPLVESWLTERPDPEQMDAQLELISMLLAAAPDQVPITRPDLVDLAKSVGKAAGGVFGLFFRLNDEEKAALETIREKLSVTYGETWKKTLAALRDDWAVTDWEELQPPRDLGHLDAADPLLFTDPKAVALYEEGKQRNMKGEPLGRDDLIEDIKIDVMRTRDWTRADLQFKALLDIWKEKGLIKDAGVFWNNSPHATVYEAAANLKFTVDDKLHRIKKGEQVCFTCQMAREMMDLDGPFVAGDFAPTASGMLCGEMNNAMMGMDDEMSGMSMSGMSMSGMSMSEGDSMGGKGGMTMGGADPGPVPRLDIDRLEVDDTDRVAYLVIDLSGSMAGQKLKMAKMAVMSFLETVPANIGVRVNIRPFSQTPFPLLLPLDAPYTMQTRMALMGRVKNMRTKSSTALYQTVWTALDDVLRLADGERMTAPKVFLVVLSDGADTDGLRAKSYAGRHGEGALFARLKHFRERGLVEYLPIAYGGRSALRSLKTIGGPGFEIRVTEPRQIVAKFADIRDRLMVGMPMRGMGGMKTG